MNYVKRVVGLPGDVVEYHPANKRITINGELVPIEIVGPYEEEPDTVARLGAARRAPASCLADAGCAEPGRHVRSTGGALLHDGRQSGQQPRWSLRGSRVRARRQPCRARDGRLDELAAAVRRRTAMESHRQGHRMTDATRHSQAGITALGFLILAVLVGVVGLAVMKVTPMYIKNMRMNHDLGRRRARAERPRVRRRRPSATSSRAVSPSRTSTSTPTTLKITQSKNGYLAARAIRRARVVHRRHLPPRRLRQAGRDHAVSARGRWAEAQLRYAFKDPSLLDLALTHRSASKAQQRAARVSRRLVPELRHCAPALRAASATTPKAT